MYRKEVFEYIKEKYNTNPQYLWEKSPLDAVFKHTTNNKWYGIIMNISKERLGLNGKENIDILNVKCPPEMIGSLRLSNGFLPAYHMNKEHWITIILDEGVESQKVKQLIDLSYELTDNLKKKLVRS